MKRLYLVLGLFLLVSAMSCTPERKAFVVKRQAVLDSPKIAPEVKERVSRMGNALLDLVSIESDYLLKMDYLLENPDESPEKQLKILNGNRWWLGMTEQEALASLGKPYPVNRTITPWGTHEQWVYRDFGLYLYFDNGILTSGQD